MGYVLPHPVHDIMQKYLQALNASLPSAFIEGVYMYGSIALGAFDEKKSDVDFIVLLKRSANEQEVEIIKEIHFQISKEKLGARMDGMYIQTADLGKTNDILLPYPYCSDGEVKVGHWDINHVTWWILKKHGIALQGRPIHELNISTKWEDVLGTLKYNINEYWYKKSKEIPNSVPDDMVEFVTTTICRILYSLKFQQIISKKEALEKGLVILPFRWHTLLKEGMRIRSSEQLPSLFDTESSRAETCKDFILYTHEICNEGYFLEV
ncbi:aminoglycoside adenylyltransferase domain-containing protein [Psychrobacillus sp. FSL K6-2843]|uniref:nucleotidyltransferase domain-containing protein n=1 Tax=Psychrobacillus sp. FSL K6-2843 TaxID=2921549 RepID=UPI003159F0DC